MAQAVRYFFSYCMLWVLGDKCLNLEDFLGQAVRYNFSYCMLWVLEDKCLDLEASLVQDVKLVLLKEAPCSAKLDANTDFRKFLS